MLFKGSALAAILFSQKHCCEIISKSVQLFWKRSPLKKKLTMDGRMDVRLDGQGIKTGQNTSP